MANGISTCSGDSTCFSVVLRDSASCSAVLSTTTRSPVLVALVFMASSVVPGKIQTALRGSGFGEDTFKMQEVVPEILRVLVRPVEFPELIAKLGDFGR